MKIKVLAMLAFLPAAVAATNVSRFELSDKHRQTIQRSVAERLNDPAAYTTDLWAVIEDDSELVMVCGLINNRRPFYGFLLKADNFATMSYALSSTDSGAKVIRTMCARRGILL